MVFLKTVFDQMEKIFSKTGQRITSLLSLFVYVYALILLPVFHFHNEASDDEICEYRVCNSETIDSCSAHLYSHDCVCSDHSDQECDVCKFLCTTVPLFSFGSGVVKVTDVLLESVLISSLQKPRFICGVLSCRAPPVVVCS